ncbi:MULTISPECIES: hypothetical protein [unclassified Streptomyces]|nr:MULTISPECIES: hypothetical protein [unclassified Streptomyces]MCX4793960.1 hypothetical protein [Streptomyces sp. NBC_01242]WSJ35375.1 hypothetical protein OG772_04430 [Streptomyces sp. NBC_01321]WSP61806.1 hypothetical protein OG466_07785 [Streptomyces sp. NBC_01240]
MQYIMLDHDSTLVRSPLPPRPIVLARPAQTAGPRHPVRPLRPALLAGEDLDAPDQHIFRGTD